MRCRIWIIALAFGWVVSTSGGAHAQALASQTDLGKLADEAQGWLAELVRINSVNPPGNEAAVAKYLSAILQKEGISNETIEIAPAGALSSRDFSPVHCPTLRTL